MKITKFKTEEEWKAARLGKVTGTRLKDIVVKRGTGEKIGFYELIAERLATPADDENPMARGIRLESEALERFEKETGKKVNKDLVMWSRDDDENIAISPDGDIDAAETAEVKCLSSARHIEAYITQVVPSEYEFQAMQYFIVKESLQTLYFVFYDPRMSVKDFFYIEIHRKNLEADIEKYLEYQRKKLEDVERIVNDLSF